MNNIGNNIRRLRKENDMSQKELGKQLFVKDSTISNWEKGKRDVNPENLSNIAKIFGCSISDLYGEEQIKSDISKPRQVIHVKDFKKDLRIRYLVLKGIFILIAIVFVIFFPNGNQDFTMVFFPIFLSVVGIDLVGCFYTKHQIKIYDVDLEKEVKYINIQEQNQMNKDWNNKVIFTFFLFLASVITLPIIYLIIQNNNEDIILTVLSVITTLLIFTNFVALIIYELRDNLKHKEISYYDFNYKLRIFLRKTLIVIYELVFLSIYTMLIFYGRNNIGVRDLWVAIIFPPMLVFISHLLYLIEMKSLSDFKINII